ncbi:rifamycin-inactivating phosphotransferase [Paractinoplanes bogorensis]|uniref:rifamycin-inactivating phosphotransferase n=1 Tax=Paractinoplanes bogorensis TaxID=1610840 RepID=UPI001FEB40D3|nr:rifamycin-inactivating phosphotransferase [Actinoplanes bogorensis]
MYVRNLRELDATQLALAGGKGANLGELMKIEGVQVPPGFCVTTEAFRQIVAPVLSDPSAGGPESTDPDRGGPRSAIESVTLPDDLVEAIAGAMAELGEQTPCAVRSSATAEDLPTASFAGQQDSFLNVVGTPAILDAVRRCWASLFTDRAVAYRERNNIDHRAVEMAVIVQQMVDAEAAGVLFTADPVSGNRRVSTVDATHGLGEALVSGLVTPDTFHVRDAVQTRSGGQVGDAVQTRSGGQPGDHEIVSRTVAGEHPALTDEQVVRLVRLGRRIEAHFGRPQDIEWCRTGDNFAMVQSRPITTLFPIPKATDGQNHVYLSVGHQQMMTDAMKPLGVSVWQMIAMAPMHEAGGRLWVDVAGRVSTPSTRAALLTLIGQGDPLFRDALESVLDEGFLPLQPDPEPGASTPGGPAPSTSKPSPGPAKPEPIATDPAIVAGLIERSQASIAALARDIAGKTGPELFEFMVEAVREQKRVLTDSQSIQAVMAGMEASWWLNEHLEQWLGEKNAADTLTLSAPGNITSEMGLALLDVADAIRPHPEMVKQLEDGILPEAAEPFLERFGMRCAGEIDITRPRWRERPETLAPILLDNVRNFQPGAAKRRFEEGRQQALDKEADVLTRLRALPDGASKAAETKRMIDRVRTFIGYREYPKYDIICRLFLYKQALLREAGSEDVFFLTYEELRAGRIDPELVRRRKDEFRTHAAMTPPRVLTSDGEMANGAYRRDDLPDGALAGLGVSAGTVEGRARVVLDMADADLEPGDILVTAYTDPSWTPVFVAVAGLVTEVGGLMTHGAVIAREYGLPAVVGVVGATRLIEDGQRIRLHGTEGYVEIL